MFSCWLLRDKRCFLMQCSFVEHRNYTVVYRRYASLFVLVGVDDEEVSAYRKQCMMMFK